MADLKQAEEQLDSHLLCQQEEKTFILRASVAQQRDKHVVYVSDLQQWDETDIGQNGQEALHYGNVCHSHGLG